MADRYLKEYITFVKESKSWFIRENRQSIIKLLKKAGIEDTDQPITELAGYGMVRSSTFSVFKNIGVRRQEIVEIINGDLREAKSVYRNRIFETFNPIYWIETIFYLPQIISGYLGFKSNSLIVKLFQILWWIIAAISTIIGILFNKEFIMWLENLRR